MFLTSITEFGFHLLMCQIIEDILVQHTWNENEIYIKYVAGTLEAKVSLS